MVSLYRRKNGTWRSVAIGSLLGLGPILMYSSAEVIRRRRMGTVLEAAGEPVSRSRSWTGAFIDNHQF